jgi:hypothetical protein
MNIEILVEDSSGARLLEILVPKILGEMGDPHIWRIHHYKGIGHIPRNLAHDGDPRKRMLLNQLPRILQGYGRTPGYDAVVVVADTDKRSCHEFLAELKAIADGCDPAPHTLFRLAIEEVEAWYLGDRAALLAAYPKAKLDVLDRYDQDRPCGTWELLANAIYPGGLKAITKTGWPLPGEIKHDWAAKIAPLLDPDRNVSPSFRKLINGLRRLAANPLLEKSG